MLVGIMTSDHLEEMRVSHVEIGTKNTLTRGICKGKDTEVEHHMG